METCGKFAIYRYTWPGRDETYICSIHSVKLIRIAEAMGLPLQLIPLSEDEHFCSQEVSDK